MRTFYHYQELLDEKDQDAAVIALPTRLDTIDTTSVLA